MYSSVSNTLSDMSGDMCRIEMETRVDDEFGKRSLFFTLAQKAEERGDSTTTQKWVRLSFRHFGAGDG